MKLRKVNGASAGRHRTLSGGTTPARWHYSCQAAQWIAIRHTARGQQGLINDIEAGKHDELLSGMTNDDRMETLDALVNPSFSLWTSIPSQTSYAGVASTSAKDQPKVISNFHTLVADPVFDGVNISIPRKVFEKVSTCFDHTLYGYFIGKRMAFLVVEYYARNNWEKHGLKRIMMNSKGFFFFKFDSRAGLEAVFVKPKNLVYIFISPF
ncbi:hypothetical protein Tco_0473060 [Tanacetum coccineum]